MSESQYSRWSMLKNLIVFQIKLAFDALRDLLLSPVSFVCALIDIIKNNDENQSQFKQLMNVGKQTDTWLNLFGQHDEKLNGQQVAKDNDEPTPSSTLTRVKESLPETNVDQVFDKIESLLKDQQVSGKLTVGARDKLNQYLEKIKSDRAHPPTITQSEEVKNK